MTPRTSPTQPTLPGKWMSTDEADADSLWPTTGPWRPIVDVVLDEEEGAL